MKNKKHIIINADLLAKVLQHNSVFMSFACNYELSEYLEECIHECVQLNRDIQFILHTAIQGEIVDNEVEEAYRENIDLGGPF